MYTQTGYDASAHTAEETRGAAIGAAQGVWRSVFFSAVIGWFVLLAFLFAATHVGAINTAGGGSITIITSALDHLWAAKLVMIIATVGQFFCGAAGLTSASRTWYAFSRDRGMPGWWLFRRINRDKVPLYAVIAVSIASLRRSRSRRFWAPTQRRRSRGRSSRVIGICTVGLYIAYIIPVYLRLRRATASSPVRGPWAPLQAGSTSVAIFLVVISVIVFDPAVRARRASRGTATSTRPPSTTRRSCSSSR